MTFVKKIYFPTIQVIFQKTWGGILRCIKQSYTTHYCISALFELSLISYEVLYLVSEGERNNYIKTINKSRRKKIISSLGSFKFARNFAGKQLFNVIPIPHLIKLFVLNRTIHTTRYIKYEADFFVLKVDNTKYSY